MKKIPDVSELKNILILRGEGSLGDAILSSCMYREIKKANPAVKISVACFGGAYDYLAKNPYIDVSYRIPARRVIRPNQRWLRLSWLGFKLRRKRFDFVLDFAIKNFYNWRFFKWLCGGDRVLDSQTSPVPFVRGEAPAKECAKQVLELFISSPVDASYELPVPPQTAARVAGFVAKHVPEGYILLNPFGSVGTRSLNREAFGYVLDFAVRQSGLPVIIPCMPAQKAVVEEYLRNVSAEEGLIYQTADVFDLFALVRGARLVITPDTAVVHVAAGFEKPTVAFYNSYHVYNSPNNPNARVVKTDPLSVSVFSRAEFEEAFHSAVAL